MVKNKILFTFLLSFFLAGCTTAPKQESTGQAIDSSIITTNVKNKILADNTMIGSSITVNTYKNTIQLSGFVDSVTQKRRAEELARSVGGDYSIEDSLIIKPN